MRTGSPDEEAVCPYDGRAHFIYEQIKDFSGSPTELLSHHNVKDYDANFQKPQPGPYRKLDHVPTTWLVNLEDIDPSWVYKYYENVVIGIKINTNNSIKEERRLHRVTNVFEDKDGDIVSEADLRTNKPRFSILDILKFKERIPYILKRLHEKSKSCGVHILSLLIAYDKVYQGNRTSEPKPSQILAARVLKMSRYGAIGERIEENKGNFHNHVMKWFRGEEGHADSYLNDALDLLSICDELGIKMSEEDPEEYDEEYINSLTVLYVTKNRDYMLNSSKRVNRDVVRELKQLSLEDYNKVVNKEEVRESWNSIVNKAIRHFLDSNDSEITKFREGNKEMSLAGFVALYNLLYKTNINVMKKRAKDGFLYDNGNNPFVMDISSILREPIPNPKGDYVLLHVSGFLVLIRQGKTLHYLDIETAVEYIGDLYNKKNLEYARYSRNQKFGKWRSTLL